MNRYLLCGLVVSMIVFNACAQAKKSTKTEQVKNETSITSIEIHRTMCYGKCPEYRLTLTATGEATYVGRKFAPFQGTYVKKVSPDKVIALFREYERFKTDTCSEKYKTIPDMAGLNYTINYKGREQIIENANSPFAPRFLMALAEDLDRLAPIDSSWTKTESWTDPRP